MLSQENKVGDVACSQLLSTILVALNVFSSFIFLLLLLSVFFNFVRGEEFRREFKDLSALKAFFPNIPVMALTATAPPHLLKSLKESLGLKANCKIVNANPNRVNIYLDKKVRMSTHHGFASYDQILLPIAHDLAVQCEKYPMTIVYLKLKYCAYVYNLFERVLGDRKYVGETRDPVGRLFAQFHAPQR